MAVAMRGQKRKRPAAASEAVSVTSSTALGASTVKSREVVDPWEGCDEDVWKRASLRYWGRKVDSDQAMTGMPRKFQLADQRESLEFLKMLASRRPAMLADRCHWRRVLDCGAGVGRNTQGVLLKLPGVERVDLLEPVAKLRARARERLAGCTGVGRYFAQPLQEFTPLASYDLVWLEWVLMYVPDRKVVAFLQRCRLRMSAGSYVVVKDNVEDSRSGASEGLDHDDFCVTRTAKHFEALFREAGFKVAIKRFQKEWPTADGAFPLMMWGLQPS